MTEIKPFYPEVGQRVEVFIVGRWRLARVVAYTSGGLRVLIVGNLRGVEVLIREARPVPPIMTVITGDEKV